VAEGIGRRADLDQFTRSESQPGEQEVRMPEDLFRTVVVRRPTARRFGAGPLSVAVHAAVIAVAVIAPLLATDVLPAVSIPLILQINKMPAVVVPRPPLPPPPGRARVMLAPMPTSATPLVAPSGIGQSGLAVSDVVPDLATSDLSTIPGVPPGAIVFDTAPPPPPEVKPPVPIRVGGKVLPPRRIRTQPPVYPLLAIAAHVQGTVVIEAVISPTGTVEHARVVTSIPLLDDAALAAVRQWVFTPTLLNGVPVPVVMTVNVAFTLR
jgi:protein TonB